MAQEEYLSDDDEEEEESTSEVAALAIDSPSPSSLFESPNENTPTRNTKCFMAKATEVSPYLPSSVGHPSAEVCRTTASFP